MGILTQFAHEIDVDVASSVVLDVAAAVLGFHQPCRRTSAQMCKRGQSARADRPAYGVAPCVPPSFGQCGCPDVSFSVTVSFGTPGASRRFARKRHAVE